MWFKGYRENSISVSVLQYTIRWQDQKLLPLGASDLPRGSGDERLTKMEKLPPVQLVPLDQVMELKKQNSEVPKDDLLKDGNARSEIWGGDGGQLDVV